MDHCLHICPSGALYKKFPLCHIPREASQCSFQMTWLLKVFHWGCFILLKERLQPCETVSQSGPMDSYYWTEHRLSFLFLWGVSLGLLLKLNKEKILCTFCTLCLFFSVSAFYRKCPSIPSSCRPRTWRATWTLASPTRPLPSSLSPTSTTILLCWHQGLWVKGVGRG